MLYEIYKLFAMMNVFLLMYYTVLDVYYYIYKKYAARLRGPWFRKIHMFMNYLTYLDLYFAAVNILAGQLLMRSGVAGLRQDFTLKNLEAMFLYIWFHQTVIRDGRWPCARTAFDLRPEETFTVGFNIEQRTITIFT